MLLDYKQLIKEVQFVIWSYLLNEAVKASKYYYTNKLIDLKINFEYLPKLGPQDTINEEVTLEA